MVFAQLIERDEASELAHQFHVDRVPSGRISLAVGIEVFAASVEGGLIGVSPSDDLDDARDSRDGAAGVVEQRQIALFIESRSMLRAWKLRTPLQDVVLRGAAARASMPNVSGSDLSNQWFMRARSAAMP